MMNSSKDTTPPPDVPTGCIAHVPTLGSICVLIPESDLADVSRFTLWNQFYADMKLGNLPLNLFTNNEWNRLARSLFKDKLGAVDAGDVKALAHLILEIPQAFVWPEVIRALAHAAANRHGEPFDEIAQVLHKRQQKDAPAQRAAWVKVRSEMMRLKLNGQPSTARAAIKSHTRQEQPEMDTKAGTLSKSFYRAKKAAKREGTFVHYDFGICTVHAGHFDTIYKGYPEVPGESPSISSKSDLQTKRSKKRR